MSTLNIATNYYKQGDVVENQIFLFDNSGVTLAPQTIATGVIQLSYYSYQTATGYTIIDLAQINFDGSYAMEDGVISIKFVNPQKKNSLRISANVVLADSSVLNFAADVLSISEGFQDPRTELANQKIPATEQILLPDLANPNYDQLPAWGQTHNAPGLQDRTNIFREPILNPVSLRADFARITALVQGVGPMDYSGGGNRYLPVGTLLKSQSLNQAPYSASLPTFVEDAITNLSFNMPLTPNPSNANRPNGYTWNGLGFTAVEQLVQDFNPNLNTWQMRFQNYSNYSPNTAVSLGPIATTQVDSTKTLTISCLLGYSYPIVCNPITLLEAQVNFYDISGAPIGTPLTIDFDPAAYQDTMMILQWSLLPANYPMGTTSINWQLTFSEINPGDMLQVNFATPQMEYLESATSRTNGARAADILSVPSSNIPLNEGTVSLQLIPGHTGFTGSTRWLFDSRTPVDPNGYAAYQSGVDGTLHFIIQNGNVVSETITTSPFGFSAGQAVELNFSWGPNQKRILNGITVLVDDGAFFTPPTASTGPLLLGRSGYTGGQAFNGEITQAWLLRETK